MFTSTATTSGARAQRTRRHDRRSTATGKSYKGLQASDLNHSPDSSPLWWEEWGDKGNSQFASSGQGPRLPGLTSQAEYSNGGDGFATERNDHDGEFIDCVAKTAPMVGSTSV